MVIILQVMSQQICGHWTHQKSCTLVQVRKLSIRATRQAKRDYLNESPLNYVVPIWIWRYVNVTWVPWRPKSPDIRLFIQKHLQTKNKEKNPISVLSIPALWGELNDPRWIPFTKGQWCGKCSISWLHDRKGVHLSNLKHDVSCSPMKSYLVIILMVLLWHLL